MGEVNKEVRQEIAKICVATFNLSTLNAADSQGKAFGRSIVRLLKTIDQVRRSVGLPAGYMVEAELKIAQEG